jgi:hypothetical protein
MKKSLITILIIIILTGAGYFAYSKGLINLGFLQTREVGQPSVNTESGVKGEDKIFTISYSNKIEGYSVDVMWKPVKVSYDHVIGPAIIEFKNIKDGNIFYISNDNFSVLKNKLEFTYSQDGTGVEKLNKGHAVFRYDEPSLTTGESFGQTDEPFFFQDLDFDNKKELILSEVDNGQRGVATFKVYKIDSDGFISRLDEPFKSLDQLSKIDIKNKQIIIHGSGGYCTGFDEVYKLKESKDEYEPNKYILETILERQAEMENNQSKCFETKYRVIDMPKELIYKKEIK